jgi:hypothetical protein
MARTGPFVDAGLGAVAGAAELVAVVLPVFREPAFELVTILLEWVLLVGIELRRLQYLE